MTDKPIPMRLPCPECGKLQDLAKGRESLGARAGSDVSEGVQAPDPEPPIVELERWEPDWDRVEATIDFQATLLEPHNVDTLRDLVAHTAHVVAKQCNDELTSLRSALADAEKRAEDAEYSRFAAAEAEAAWTRAEVRSVDLRVERNKAMMRIAELEAIAPRIEPSDEEILRAATELYRARWGYTEYWKPSAVDKDGWLALARAVLALTRPPEGAARCTERLPVPGTVGFEQADGAGGTALLLTEGPGTLHCVFVPTETKEQG